jgi:hypothetical protein
LFWFDSIGCALGGSQQDDAKILLKHYRAMSATADSSRRTAGEGGGPARGSGATTFVSGFKTNPVDASFLNGHMMRAMDYNDIYWKADPCHPSDLIAAPLALCALLKSYIPPPNSIPATPKGAPWFDQAAVLSLIRSLQLTEPSYEYSNILSRRAFPRCSDRRPHSPRRRNLRCP